jgi:1,4-alpha-glucan branching enzyme
MAETTESAAKPVRFEVVAEPGSKVFVAGSFNGWNSAFTQLFDSNDRGVCTATVYLPAGTYEYKFVVNGVWCADSNCPRWTQNSYGSLNSLLVVE